MVFTRSMKRETYMMSTFTTGSVNLEHPKRKIPSYSLISICAKKKNAKMENMLTKYILLKFRSRMVHVEPIPAFFAVKN